MRHGLWIVGLAAVAVAMAQKYAGPVPPKADIPYIKQASDLIATEAAEAKEEKAGTGSRYIVAGAASPVRTPLSLPVFIVKADQLAAGQLQLYKMESKEGHREYVVGGANPPDVLHMDATKVSETGVWRVAVSDPLDAGEYVLFAGGGKQVFCFQVF